MEEKFFETSKTTQNGKYKCSYFTTCGLTGAILYQNLASVVLYKQRDKSLFQACISD